MKTTTPSTDRWLKTLGYDDSVGIVHRSASIVSEDHPYSREIRSMLSADGDIQSSAVYEIDRVPAVCFLESSKRQAVDPEFLDEVRRKIWNQNLVSIVVVIQDDQATAYPAPRTLPPAPALHIATASKTGPFSASDVTSGEVHARLPNWFDRRNRVDRVLLDNLSEVVRLLTKFNLSTEQAQLLVGKCIFVSYLEDRGIVGEHYRERHNVGKLLSLLISAQVTGLDKLFRRLKADFNGDLLDIEGGSNVDWR
ncbi:MAG: DNA methylase, partial [Burkholderiales bacterium]|nr:DNA methylase [Burkholderiales bacterium]